MTVEFCPECGNMLRKKRFDDGIFWACGCGFRKKAEPVTRKRKILPHQRKKLIPKTVIIENVNLRQNPTTKVECPKCGHFEAEYFQMQTRSADEPPTTFYKCLKCGHTWRAY